MALLTVVGNSQHLEKECSKLKSKQLSLEMALTLGWPLVIKTTLLPQAEVLVMAEAAGEVGFKVEVSDLSAKAEKVIPESQGTPRF
ncbi:hypothetical protein ABBQ38_006605 [Trebouxia sp. C0009 RCD-2024]